jgi:hypothetical protein
VLSVYADAADWWKRVQTLSSHSALGKVTTETLILFLTL